MLIDLVVELETKFNSPSTGAWARYSWDEDVEDEDDQTAQHP